LLADERMEKQDRWYIFDGRWLVERLDDRKQFIGQEVEPPPGSMSPTAENAPGGGVDPLAMGQGPFVVPISPDKDRILARYEVMIVPPAEDDPPNALHLRLTPREGQRISFTSVDLWYDRESLMPQRVRTIDDSENQSIVKLSKLEMNPDVPDDLFRTTPPQERGWDVQLSPWEEKPTAPAALPPGKQP
ncbi:MAG: outer-membrane lipoprotein carrier protein LolA, partial [Phycisphaeraceae bacterium]|nr:outer-membrane lipoprotein carrier protein LolA [Phycisphaeraceae bacterium]